jgi:hypothetical protein
MNQFVTAKILGTNNCNSLRNLKFSLEKLHTFEDTNKII